MDAKIKALSILHDLTIDHSKAMDMLADIWVDLGMVQSFSEFCESLCP